MLDPISDMLTRIRNMQMAKRKEVFIPASKMKMAIAKILEKRGFVYEVQSVSLEGRPFLKVVLRYDQISRTQKDPAIHEIKQVSTQGQRTYVRKQDIRRVKNGLGVAIISTSQGVMAGEDAHKKGLGGEYICQVW